MKSSKEKPMNRPKITEGEWRAVNNGAHWNNKEIDNWEIQYSDDGECVVDHVYEEADARAISSVPEMLDALMSLENDDGSIPDHVWDMRNNALKKAGAL
jgi:hypothetical protein